MRTSLPLTEGEAGEVTALTDRLRGVPTLSCLRETALSLLALATRAEARRADRLAYVVEQLDKARFAANHKCPECDSFRHTTECLVRTVTQEGSGS